MQHGAMVAAQRRAPVDKATGYFPSWWLFSYKRNRLKGFVFPTTVKCRIYFFHF